MRTTHFVALAAATLLLAACGTKEAPAPVVRPVQLAQVKLGAGSEAAVFAGEVKPRHEGDLGFRIPGKLIERFADVGTAVKKGQVLARLDPADVGLQAEAARAQLRAAETEFRFSQSEFERYQNLHREKFISASALDAKRNSLDANRAKFEQAKANLAVSQNQATYATLVATDNGIVTAVNAEPGQVVTAGQAVLRLARDDEREVLISVPENRLVEVRDASKLVVALWATPDKLYRGRVREVSPSVDPATRTFAVRVTIVDPDPGVRWGMTANVGVVNAGAAGTALVPLTALHQMDGAPALWRFDPATNVVALKPVTVGQYREDGIVVTAGVADGEWIVIAGVHKLQPGQVVRPYDAGPAAVSAPPVVPAKNAALRS